MVKRLNFDANQEKLLKRSGFLSLQKDGEPGVSQQANKWRDKEREKEP